MDATMMIKKLIMQNSWEYASPSPHIFNTTKLHIANLKDFRDQNI